MENFCRICQFQESGKKLTNHIKKAHGLSSIDYTILCIYGGKRPVCPVCSSETRYVSFKFMNYCKNHSSIAESVGGKIGGKAPAWNKGLTADTNTRIFRPAGELNSFWGKKHTEDTRQKISKSKRLCKNILDARLSARVDDFSAKFNIESYQNRQNQYLEFTCKICGENNSKTLQTFERGSQCNFCHPNTSSQPELEIEKWLSSFGIKTIRSDRSVIAPKELDITVPEKKFAIEFDGLYWHSEFVKEGIEKNLHKTKTQMCLDKGWQLMHVFSDDWITRKDIVKSMILHKLGIFQERVHARTCFIKEMSKKERQLFFEQNHLSGDVSSKKAWCLVDKEDQIVAAISVRLPLQKKWSNRLEIARFAIKGGKHVPGALSKLLQKVKEFAVEENKLGLISYADRRHGEGKCYLMANFVYEGNTGLDYWYTDGAKRVDRFTMRSKNNITEKQKAEEAGMRKIWGCGNNVWVLDF